ncbi:AP-1 complex subunit beta-1 [Coemansia sp. S610]|nr:AP-1 complex subunit beta-1 [Coemansia sp. S610]
MSPALTRLTIAAPPVSRLPRTMSSAMSQPAAKPATPQAPDMPPALATPRSSNTQLTSSALDISSGAVGGMSNPYINDYTPGPMAGNDAVLIDLMSMEDDEDAVDGGGAAINSGGMVGFNANFGMSGMNLASMDPSNIAGAASQSSMPSSQQVLNSAFDAAGLDALSNMPTSASSLNRPSSNRSPMPDLMRQFTSSFDLSGASSGVLSGGSQTANGSSQLDPFQQQQTAFQQRQLQSAAFSLSAPATSVSGGHLGPSAFPAALSPTSTFFGASSASPFNNPAPFSPLAQSHNSNLTPNSAPPAIRNTESSSTLTATSHTTSKPDNSAALSREVDELAAKMYNTGMLNSFSNNGGYTANASATVPYVPSQKVLLDAAQTQGLEILGTFARRNGSIQMEMSFVNKSGMSIGDFAIQFNKNTYGITPSGSLNAGTVMPMSSVEVGLPLVTGGPTMEMQPLTNIQIAVKCTAGIFYFQTQYSLHILLEESGQSDQGMFLRMWKDMPENMQSSHTAQNLRFASMEDMRNKLNMNSVFTVAQRSFGNATHFYTSSKLCDGSMFYSEIKVANNFQAAIIVTKSINTRLIPLYQKAIEDICTAF